MPKIATSIPILVPDERDAGLKSPLKSRGVPGGLPAPSSSPGTRLDTAPNQYQPGMSWKKSAQWVRFFHSGRPAGDSWNQPRGGRLATDTAAGRKFGSATRASEPGQEEPQALK